MALSSQLGSFPAFNELTKTVNKLSAFTSMQNDLSSTMSSLTTVMDNYSKMVSPLSTIFHGFERFQKSISPLEATIRTLTVNAEAIFPAWELLIPNVKMSFGVAFQSNSLVEQFLHQLDHVSLPYESRFPRAVPRLLAAARLLEAGRTKRVRSKATHSQRFSRRTITAAILVADQQDVIEAPSDNIVLIRNVSSAYEEAQTDKGEDTSDALAVIRQYATAWYLQTLGSAETLLRKIELHQFISAVFLALGLASAVPGHGGGLVNVTNAHGGITASQAAVTPAVSLLRDETARLCADLDRLPVNVPSQLDGPNMLVEVIHPTGLHERPRHQSTVMSHLQVGAVGQRLEEDNEWIRVAFYDHVTNEYISGWMPKKYTCRLRR